MYLTQCKYCGTYFGKQALEEAITKNKKLIECEYCGHSNEFSVNFQRNLDNGFNALAEGNFGEAENYFGRATEERLPQPDAFLGMALAQMHVQVIFSSDDPTQYPELIFHTCPEENLSDNDYYGQAIESLANLDREVQESRLAQLNRYADHVDGFRKSYLDIAASKVKYGVFIAYEDEGDDLVADFNKAVELREMLPEKLGNIFLPGMDDEAAAEEDAYGNRLRYEASILYAINNSKCMAVIADSNINSRLRNVYTRYFNANKRRHARDLCFVRIARRISVNLPDSSPAEYGENLFDFSDPARPYLKFIYACNGIQGGAAEATPAEREEQKETAPLPQDKPSAVNTADMPKKTKDGKYEFGFYPQSLVTDKSIVAEFESCGLPDPDDAHGWTVMFSDEFGPYTWFKDEEIDGAKYRAVYFIFERKPFSGRDGDDCLFYQNANGYKTQNVYCFKFEPIMWRVIKSKQYYIELVSDLALDCREFGAETEGICWDNCDLRLWLNDEFWNTAFSENGRQCLMRRDESDDVVFLMDFEQDKQEILNGSRSVMCSDYFMCLGGRCNNHNIDSFWVSSPVAERNAKAPVINLGGYNSKSTTYPDSTMVAVLPKIVIRN